jgi:hypothetical protein
LRERGSITLRVSPFRLNRLQTEPESELGTLKMATILDTHPMKSREIAVSARLTQAAAIFVVVSILSLLILSKAKSIVWEDHFQIGQNLRSTGALTIDGVPSVFRPPGFPTFVAASLWIGDALSAPKDAAPQRSAEHDQHVVVFAQGLLLGAMAAALFFSASLWTGFVPAASIASTAALNPYSLALANLVSYHLLFVVLTIFSTLRLFSLRHSSSSWSTAAGAGILWGLTSLVKPVTLVIPFFIGALMLFRLPTRPTVKLIVLIGLGMVAIVGPYVGRNYWITGHPIITAQSGFAFWGTSIEKIGPNEPFLVWEPIWWKSGMPIFSRVTGSAEYSRPLLNAYAVELNAEFSKEARNNIVAAPEIYLYNVIRNLVSFNLDTMGFWNKFLVAHNTRLVTRLVPVLSEFWIISLMMLAAAGIVWGCISNDDEAMTVAVIYLGIVVAHSISFSTELYTIVKLPLIILGFALLVRQLELVPRYGAVLARLTTSGMAGLGLLISGLAVT